ncbi:MAG TPA: hypothetical protein ENK19_00385 [Acidobacteria bacterium]|nr:hypothetical protein [Acidobacteriota bacterium]
MEETDTRTVPSVRDIQNRIAGILDLVHAAYMTALLPLAALVFLSQRTEAPSLLLLLAGVAAAVYYLVGVLLLAPGSRNIPWALVLLLDGPLFTLAGGWAELRGLVLRTWLIEAGGVALAVVFLLPAQWPELAEGVEEVGGILAVGVALLLAGAAGVLVLPWPLLPDLAADGSWMWVAAGVGQGALARLWQLRAGGQPKRRGAQTLILVGVISFTIAFIAGALLGQTGHPL